MKTCALLGALVGTFVMLSPLPADDAKPVMRIGIIGCDTSHVTAFTKLFNEPGGEDDLAGFKVVAAYPAGTDIPLSKDRVQKFTAQIRDKWGVEIVNSIDELLPKVDVILLESVDGKPHLEQATPVIKAKKKLFIDKPVAGSLADVLRIYQLAKEYNTPIFSSSSTRFSPGILGVKNDPKNVGKVLGCVAYSPCALDPNFPDLFWYGVHGIEMLYTIMGTGCESVTRSSTKSFDVVTGVWNDGRIGTYRGLRAGKDGYGALVFGSHGIVPAGPYAGYKPLVVEIAKFFRTGVPPVAAEETIEMFAFMEAAHESKRRDGAPVTLEEVLATARGK
jgi:predicted dehydrogenase